MTFTVHSVPKPIPRQRKPLKRIKRTPLQRAIPKSVKRKKAKVPKQPSLKEQCDALWSACIHARSGEQSELTGKPGPIHAHHIERKGNYRLRYELRNGIALTSGEHRFGVHGSDPMKWEELITQKIGAETRDWLRSLRSSVSGSGDLGLNRLYLQQKLAEFTKKK